MIVHWRDGLRLASKLTLKRLLNAVKITFSFYWSRFKGKPFMWGLPVSIAIEPTTACNLRCPECPSGLRSFTRPTGKLDKSLFEKVIQELAPYTTWLTFYFQGEPYLHPEFTALVSMAHRYRMYTSTSTNAHFLTPDTARQTVLSGLDRLIISIDGVTQETYSAYRKSGELAKVLEGTRQILQARKEMNSSTPYVIWQFLAVRPNEHEIPTLHQLAKEYGVDKVAIKTAQLYDYVHGHELMPTKPQYSRYHLKSDGTYGIKNEWHNHCWKMWHSCVITWDGRVVPCCFDKDAQHLMGLAGNDAMKEIWYNQNYSQFRQSLLRGRNEIEMCRNCSEGTKVWAETAGT